MRLSELQLIRYGHFEDCRLRFPPGDRDLQILFGPNEAGKSTTMAAVGDLLFGFPHITQYDFRFDRQLLRVGGVLTANGADLAIRRKKGNKATLLDGDDKPIDEGALIGLLSGHNVESFQRMFSLDHGRLRAGGRAILDAQDDVGQAIFAAGSGLVGIARILDGLEEEAKAIWTKRAGDRLYYVAQRAFDEARARQKQAQLKPAAWDDSRKRVEQLESALSERRERRRALEQERDQVERQRRVLPHAILYRDVATRLTPLADAPDLPPDAAAIFAEVATATAATAIARRLADEEREAVDGLLGAIMVDDALAGRDAEIQALRETRGAVDKGLADLPRRQAELQAKVATLQALQRELGWPDEAAQAAARRLPKRVDVARARALLEEKSAVDAVLDKGQADETAARRAHAAAEQGYRALPPARDVAALVAVLKRARALGDIDKAIGDARRQLDRRERDLATRIAQLAPWSGSADMLRAIAGPGRQAIGDARSAADAAALALAEAKRQHRVLVNRSDELDLARTILLRDAQAIAADTLRDARTARDAIWQDLRGHIAGASPLPAPSTSADDFEQAVAAADDVADRRFAMAEQSARLAAIENDLEAVRLQIAHKARSVADAEAEIDRRTSSWGAILAPLGLSLDPAAFLEWSARRELALTCDAEADAARAVHDDLRARRDEALARLAAAIAAFDPIVPESFQHALDLADRIAQAESEADQVRQAAHARLNAAAAALDAAVTSKAAAGERLAGWSGQWRQAVAALGLDDDQPAAVIRVQLDLLEQLRGETEEMLRLGQRIAAIEADRAAFAGAVRALAAACGMAADARDPAAILTGLAEAAAAAQDARKRRDALLARKAAAEQRLREAAAAEALALARLTPLFALAGTSDRDVLVAAIRRADEARGLRSEMQRLSDELLKAGGGPALPALLAEIADADAGALSTRSAELQEQLAALAEEIATHAADHATARADFNRIDAGPDAAIAAADAEQARAEMAFQADAYVRKRAEAMVLRAAMARYRAQKQIPLVQRASALFATLTLGSYAGLLVDVEASRLSGVRDDQSVVPVGGMSEGTVDQLFLALRIAAVEDAVTSGARLPFLADDLFINYDDERATAGFQVLAELAEKTQVLFFTHHQHLVKVAEDALAPAMVSSCRLG